MHNIIKLLTLSLLVVSCKTGYQLDKKNIVGAPERNIASHSVNITNDIAATSQAATSARNELISRGYP